MEQPDELVTAAARAFNTVTTAEALRTVPSYASGGRLESTNEASTVVVPPSTAETEGIAENVDCALEDDFALALVAALTGAAAETEGLAENVDCALKDDFALALAAAETEGIAENVDCAVVEDTGVMEEDE